MNLSWRALKLVVRGAVLLLVFLFGFELTVRVDDWARFDVPLDGPLTTIEELLVRDSLGQHARPSAVFKRFRINSRGFRGDELPASALRMRPLVITSGASETFGLYEQNGHEWPMQLADSLRSRCSLDTIMVLNAALAGMSLPTVLQDVRLRLVPLHPRVLIYYPTPTQYLYASSPRASPLEREPAKPLSLWRSRAAPRLRDALKRAVPEPVLNYLRVRETIRLRSEGSTPFSTVPVERLDSMEAHLRNLVGEVRRGGAQIVLVQPEHRFADTSTVVERRWLRSWERQVPKATAVTLLGFHQGAVERIRRVATDSGVALVVAALATRVDRSSLFADFSHFTDRGSAIMGGATASVVAGLLGCGRVP